MSEWSRVRSATDEDLLEDFGPEGFLIGLPVRPADYTPPEQPPAQEEEGSDGAA